jgi:hypothetical protein
LPLTYTIILYNVFVLLNVLSVSLVMTVGWLVILNVNHRSLNVDIMSLMEEYISQRTLGDTHYTHTAHIEHSAHTMHTQYTLYTHTVHTHCTCTHTAHTLYIHTLYTQTAHTLHKALSLYNVLVFPACLLLPQ